MLTSMSMLMLVVIMCYYLDIHDENPRKLFAKTFQEFKNSIQKQSF